MHFAKAFEACLFAICVASILPQQKIHCYADSCQESCSYQSYMGNSLSSQQMYDCVMRTYKGTGTSQDNQTTQWLEREVLKTYPNLFATEASIAADMSKLGIPFAPDIKHIGGKSSSGRRRRRRGAACETVLSYSYPNTVTHATTGEIYTVATITTVYPAQKQYFTTGTCPIGSCQEVLRVTHTLVTDNSFSPPFVFVPVNIPAACSGA